MRALLVIACLVAAVTPASAGADLRAGLAAMDRSQYDIALRELTPLAENGDPVAQFGIGKMHLYGWGVPENPAEAARWFRKAAEQGERRAQKLLAHLYDKGHGVPHDEEQARLWQRAAEAPRGTPPSPLITGPTGSTGNPPAPSPPRP